MDDELMFGLKIYNHKKLHPKIWHRNGTIRPQVERTLRRIADSVVFTLATYSGIPVDMESDLVDIYLCGSCVEYFYGGHSDLDLKIMIKPDRYLSQMDEEIYIEFTKFVRSNFIERYAPSVCGIKMDIGITNLMYPFPNYSLLKKRWTQKPERFTDSELILTTKRAGLFYKSMRRMAERILKNKEPGPDAKALHFYLKRRRIESWHTKNGNRSAFSLAFSYFNRRGYINKLLKADQNYMRNMILNLDIDTS